MELGLSGELVSCSTWMFETIPEKEPPWKSTEKPAQGLIPTKWYLSEKS